MSSMLLLSGLHAWRLCVTDLHDFLGLVQHWIIEAGSELVSLK